MRQLLLSPHFSLLVLIAASLGCSKSMDLNNTYTMIKKKVGTTFISQVNIRYPGFVYVGGEFTSLDQARMGPGSLSTFNPIPLPMSPDVTISWRTQDGVFHEHVIHVPPETLPGPRDQIVFTFHDDDRITVQRFAHSEMDKAMKVEIDEPEEKKGHH